MSIRAAPDVLFLMKARTLSSKLWGSTFVYVDLCFHRSAVGLWATLMCAALTMAVGIGSFKLSDQLPDHVQQVDKFRNLGGSLHLLELTDTGGRALHVPPVGPVGESVPSFSCCLGGVHNLASDTCCKSLHRKVDVFVKRGDLFSSQSIFLLSFVNELVPCPTLASVQPISTYFRNLGQSVRPTMRARLTTDGRTTCSSRCSRKCLV